MIRLLSRLFRPRSLEYLARLALSATQEIDRAMGRPVAEWDALSKDNQLRYLAIAEAVARGCGRRVA